MDTFFKFFDARVLNAFAAVGLVFLHFTFFKLFQRSDPERGKFFFYLAVGWVANLFYLMFLDLLPKLSIDPSLPRVIIRTLNTLTFFYFLLASRWQIPPPLRSQFTRAAILFSALVTVVSWASVSFPSKTALLYAPGVVLAPIAVAAVGFNYHQHFHLTRESLPAGTKAIIICSIYLYAILQCCLFLLPPFSTYLNQRISHFEDILFMVGATLKLGNILGLALYSEAVFADYQKQAKLVERARLCVNLSDQLSHEIQTPATELRVRIENASQVHGSLAGTDLLAVKRLVGDVSSIIEVFENYQSDQRFDQPQAHEPEICNLNTICDEVVFSLKATMRPKCRFEKLYDAKPTVFALKTEVSQIARNIVKNAVEAVGRRTTNSGISTIILQTRTESEQGRAHLVVRDNGPGINPLVFERIFEDGVTTNKGRGRGHGLFISKTLAQKNGGSIRAFNIEANSKVLGAEFHVVFPLMIRQTSHASLEETSK